MTQLIAVMCEGGKKIVTVSDRMVSTSDMTLAFEPEERKAQLISHKALVLVAGTVHEPDLIRDAKERTKGRERIREIADGLKELYQDLRASRIEDEMLRPCAGVKTIAEYHEKQRMLHDAVVMQVNEGLLRYQLGLILLLAGVDEQGHLILIQDPGVWRSYDNMGYCCAGMGERHAENVFAWYQYTQRIPLNEAAYIAFEAKKKAEMAGGVGRATDMLIIADDGVKAVKQETITALEGVYNERENRSQRRSFDKTITDVQIQLDAVEVA